MVCFEMEDQGVPQDPKSGCKAEESKLTTAQRLTDLISLFLILRLAGVLDDDAQPCRHLPPTLASTATEIGVLDRLVN
ncbi:hypothetical protein [Bradyrhizobium archetypum]|uniref:Uncharacterized protein n=1 Tax=Bradyrhizobium archetypum TaxID=2721160 RepID=A0A7Y4H9W8_9BRAD|nr:hypothetical protein [Bradyrhizobium archetypum]NOJ50093.1 hypothetical protein [Bradyrhizobium archetypum]